MEKGVVVYSSVTGNTKKLAEFIRDNWDGECDIFDVKEKPDLTGASWVIAGFWVDKGTADKGFLQFLEGLREKRICLVGTLGAYPDSDHARSVAAVMREEVEKHNSFLGCYLCQGRINPKLTEQFASLPPDHPHAMTEERRRRHAEAAKHPDQADLQAGLAYCKEAIAGL